MLYTPPEGEARFRDLLANCERFLHEEETIDPLVRMAAAHYQLEAIHPFTDCNGRTGRAKLPMIYNRELVDVIVEQPYCRIANLVEAKIAGRQAASRHLKALVSIS